MTVLVAQFEVIYRRDLADSSEALAVASNHCLFVTESHQS